MPRSGRDWIFPNGNKDANISQEKHRDIIIEFLKTNNCKFRHCCDVGSHIGTWSDYFVEEFQWVYAFEPIEELRNCFKKNIQQSNYTLYPFGLGNSTTDIKFQYDSEKSGVTQVNTSGNYTAKICKLDDLNLKNVDYIKMDAEGYELEILKGAADLLKNQSPILHIEMKLKNLAKFNLNKHDVRNWLYELNYDQALKVHNEFIFVKDVAAK